MITVKRRAWVYLALIAMYFHTANAQGPNYSSAPIGGPSENKIGKKGEFISVRSDNGTEYRMYAAGPDDAKAAILFVHDYFGISESARQSVDRLGALGYRTVAIDLYKGRSATTHDSAMALMNAKDSNETKQILQFAIGYLIRPSRKLASVGFSAGGVDAMNANLLAPDLFKATVIVYGGGYDKIEKERLDKLKSPVLAITGALDEWPRQSALNFLTNQKSKSFELFIYPGVDHGYAQPLFNGGKNYNAEATRVTWMLLEDFLARNL